MAERKYKPGDLVLVRAKIKSITENDSGEVTYKVSGLNAGAYETMNITDEDIRGCLQEKLEE